MREFRSMGKDVSDKELNEKNIPQEKVVKLRKRLLELGDDVSGSSPQLVKAGGDQHQEVLSLRKELSKVQNERADMELQFMNQISMLAIENQSTIENLQNKLDASTKVVNLKKETENAESERLKEKSEEEKLALLMKVEKLKKDRANADHELAENKLSLDQMHGEILELLLARDELAIQNDSLTTTFEEKDSLVEAMKSHLDELEKDYSERNKKLKNELKQGVDNKKGNKLLEMTHAVTHLEGVKSNLLDKLLHLREELRSQETVNSDLRQKLEQQQALNLNSQKGTEKEQEKDAANKNLQQQLDEKQHSLSNIEQCLNQEKTAHSMLQQQFEGTQEGRMKYQIQFEEEREAHSKLKEQFYQQENHLKLQTQQLDERQVSVLKVQQCLNQEKTAHSMLQQQFEKVQESSMHIQAQFEEEKEDHSGLKEKFCQEQENQSKLQKRFRLEYMKTQGQLEEEQEAHSRLKEKFCQEQDNQLKLQKQFRLENEDDQDLKQQLDKEKAANSDSRKQCHIEKAANAELQRQLKEEREISSNLHKQLDQTKLINLELEHQHEKEQSTDLMHGQQIVEQKVLNTELREQFQQQKQINSELNEQFEKNNNAGCELREQLRQEQALNADFQHQLEQVQVNSAKLQKQLDEEQEANSKLNEKLERNQEIDLKLRTQIQAEQDISVKLKNVQGDEEKMKLELQRGKELTSELQTELNNEKKLNSNLQISLEKINHTTEINETSQAEINKLKENLECVQTDLCSVRNAYQSDAARLEDELISSRLEITKKKCELERLGHMLSDKGHENDLINKQVADLRSKVVHGEKKIQGLEDHIKKLSQEIEIGTDQEQHKRLKPGHEIERLTEQLSIWKDHDKQQSLEFEGQIKSLSGQLQTKQSRVMDLMTELELIRKENNFLNDEICSLKHSLEKERKMTRSVVEKLQMPKECGLDKINIRSPLRKQLQPQSPTVKKHPTSSFFSTPVKDKPGSSSPSRTPVRGMVNNFEKQISKRNGSLISSSTEGLKKELQVQRGNVIALQNELEASYEVTNEMHNELAQMEDLAQMYLELEDKAHASEQEIFQLKSNIREYEGMITEAQNCAHQHEEKGRELERNAEKEIKLLQTNIEIISKKLRCAEDEIERLNVNVDHASLSRKEFERKSKQDQIQIEKLRSKVTLIEAENHSEIENFTTKIKLATSFKQQCGTQSKMDQAEIERLRAEMVCAEKQNQERKLKNLAEILQLKEMLAEAKQSLGGCERKMIKGNGEIEKLHSKINAESTNKYQEEVTRLRAQVSSLQTELNVGMTSADNHKDLVLEEKKKHQLSHKSQDNEIKHFQLELTNTQISKADMERDYMNRVHKLEKEIDRMHHLLEEQLRVKEGEINELQMQLSRKIDEVSSLVQQREQICSSMNSMSASRKNEMEEIQDELMQMTQKTASQSMEIQTLKMRIDEQKFRNEELEALRMQSKQLEHVGRNQVKRSTEKELNELREENLKLRELMRNISLERRTLQDKLDVIVSDKRSSSKSTQVLRDRNIALKREVEKLSKRLKKIECNVTRFTI